MKIKVVLLGFLLGCFLLAGAQAQTALPTKYQIAISGVCYTTNSSGRIITQTISNRSLMQQVATADGTSDFSNWGLAYHVHGGDLGDTIEIIDKNSGATLRVLFGLYFGEDVSLGRGSLRSASGQQTRRVEYIYTYQNSHSMGSALLTDYFWFDTSGNPSAHTVLGQMQWLVLVDSRDPGTQICSASFTTLKPWNF